MADLLGFRDDPAKVRCTFAFLRFDDHDIRGDEHVLHFLGGDGKHCKGRPPLEHQDSAVKMKLLNMKYRKSNFPYLPTFHQVILNP